MPIYEYQCTKCGEVFEAFQKITDDPLTQCRFCQARVEKLISQSTFQLKGSGWYLTDYAKKNSSGSGERSKTNSTAEKPSETKTSTDSTSTATSSESKP
ncbi:MAG: zinc ribbon domain-containing protein [Acidobacteriota bacterium]|nr:zinc ribbon domain-containing protein [Acidobacteriota bacterium]